jgi:hypothetical protein
MKIVFSLAILLGFGGTLAGAHYLPVTHTRLPSQTSVVANGGRAERFIVRLPTDRLAATDAAAGGLRATGGAMAVPAQFVASSLLVEHFKVRDTAGKVIGIAARHWSDSDRGLTTTWSVLIPSRGTLLLSSPGEARGAIDSALQTAGYNRQGDAWTGNVAVTLTPKGETGTIAAGSGEFAALSGSYTETWTLTGVEAGEMRGTIELSTVTNRTP